MTFNVYYQQFGLQCEIAATYEHQVSKVDFDGCVTIDPFIGSVEYEAWVKHVLPRTKVSVSTWEAQTHYKMPAKGDTHF